MVNSSPRKVKRADVAARARTSEAVISYVINGHNNRVSAATRDRVLAAIADLGYRPNGVAKALRSQASRAIGLLVPDIGNSFFAELSRSIEECAFQRGYFVLLGTSRQDASRELAYIQAFLDQQVDGIVLVTAGGSRALSDLLMKSTRPFVLVDRKPRGIRGPTVVVDNEIGAKEAVRHLVDHGHTRIACLTGPDNLSPAASRRRGYRAAMAEAGLSVHANSEVSSPFDWLAALRAARDLLTSRPRPTAVFTCTDLQGIALLRTALELHIAVPRDVAVVSFDGSPQSELSSPGLSTMMQPIDQLGGLSITRLLAAIETNGQERSITFDSLPVRLIRRGSCGCSDSDA
jgi:LacI family transcriptional regulator